MYKEPKRRKLFDDVLKGVADKGFRKRLSRVGASLDRLFKKRLRKNKK